MSTKPPSISAVPALWVLSGKLVEFLKLQTCLNIANHVKRGRRYRRAFRVHHSIQTRLRISRQFHLVLLFLHHLEERKSHPGSRIRILKMRRDRMRARKRKRKMTKMGSLMWRKMLSEA